MKYAGIGARKTPNEILKIMEDLAAWLERRNFILRSGGAKGADSAFEKGVINKKEIFYANDATDASTEIAKRFHPAWNRLSSYAKKLHSRNAFQVLGKNLNDPVDLLICWTPDGCISDKERTYNTGGTGTAISIADAYNIPVFNLQSLESKNALRTYLRSYK